MNIDIEDKVITRTQTITRIEIEVQSLILGISARFTVKQYSENNIIDISYVDMEGADYTAWGSDDTYVENYVLQTLGFSKKQ